MRSAHLLSSVAASAITAHLGGGGGPVDPGTDLSTSFADISANLLPVAGWGAIRRNPDYAGPCCRVADNDSAAEVDLYFDEYGMLSGPLPFTNTRVVAIYDQWGSDHLYCAKTAHITLTEMVNNDNCCGFNSIGTTYMRSTLTTSTGAAWAIADGLWALSFIRRQNSGLQGLWGVDKSTNYMSIGLWQEYEDLHWRINGSDAVDWFNTDWNLNAADVQNVKGTAIGDYTQGDALGRAYFNGVTAGSLSYTAPITYDSGVFLKLFGASTLGSLFYGDIYELHIFSRVAAASGADITNLHNALSENDAALGIPRPNKVAALKRTTIFRHQINRITAFKRTTVIRNP